MTTLLYILISLVFYAYFGYALLVLVLGRLVRRPVRKADIEPHVTLMIAAYNEERGIAAKLENSLKLDYPKDKLRILVVSDGSTDRTDEIVRSYAPRGVELMRVEGRVGKTQARNVAIAAVQADIVLFSDATTEYRPDLIRKMVRNFADPEVGMVTGHLVYRDEAGSQMGTGQKLFWRYEAALKKAQTSLGTLTGSVGCATAFRHALYHPLPPNIIEDFTGPLMLVLKGQRVVYEEEAVCHELTTQKSANEWKMRVHVVRGGMAGMLYARRILNPLKYPVASFQLLSHKVLRWLLPVVGIMILAVNLAIVLGGDPDPVPRALLALQGLFYGCAGVAWLLERSGRHARLVAVPLYFIVLNAASLVALVKTATTNLEATWETQR